MRQKRIYTVLAAFNLLSAVASIVLVQVLLASFSASLESSRTWAARIDGFARIVKLAGDANAPGNDVFEHKDVARARREEAVAGAAEREQLRIVRAELATTAEGQSLGMLAQLDAAEAAFERMHRSSLVIFDRLEAGDDAGAGSEMAGMDQGFAALRDVMEDARTVAVAASGGIFDAQHRTADTARMVQVGLALLGLVVVFAVTSYGMKLARRFDEAQARLARQKDDMQLVFDNVAQGFLTVDAKGAMAEEHSKILEAWFGPVQAGAPFWSYVTRTERDAAWMQMAFEGVVEGMLPTDVAVDQMPRRLVVDGRPIRIDYRPVLEGGALEKLVLVCSDVTEDERRERVESEQQETLALFEGLGKDREGTLDFVADADRMVSSLAEGTLEPAKVRHLLHTLKGNCSIFHQASIAAHCHDLETALADAGPRSVLDAEQRSSLVARWSKVKARVASLVGDAEGGLRRRVEIDEHEYVAVLRAAAEEPREAVISRISSWKLESTQARLQRLAEQTRGIAKRIGKLPLDVRVEVDPEARRLPAGSWTEVFASMVHVVRNAVDHGVEPAAERAESGKSDVPCITLRAHKDGNDLVLEVEDDGRGVDWERLAAKGRQHGLPCAEKRDLVALLFADGVSTREEVTETSGRGVGLGAIYDECVRRGGVVNVRTEPGRGTCFSFVIPSTPVSRIPCAPSMPPRLSVVPVAVAMEVA
jgi:two-component system chemotaxis sensor kinase CheA